MKIIVSVFFLAALVTITSLLMSSSFHNECKDIYEEHGTTGSFVLYDHKNDSYDYCDEKRCEKRFCPASTFKIPNSIIGLETGAIDPEEKFKWDGKQRAIPSWNQDHVLKSAYHHSVVPYYKDLARKVGEKKMRTYLKKFEYGNMDCSGKIDEFWLNGVLEISQKEQIEFLKKLFDKKLGLSKRTDSIMNDIMVFKKTDNYIIRAKTGASLHDKVGWFVGWVEIDENVYFFANNIEFDGKLTREFMKKRIDTALDILKKKQII
jgi:beta-lactamase class D